MVRPVAVIVVIVIVVVAITVVSAVAVVTVVVVLLHSCDEVSVRQKDIIAIFKLQRLLAIGISQLIDEVHEGFRHGDRVDSRSGDNLVGS